MRWCLRDKSDIPSPVSRSSVENCLRVGCQDPSVWYWCLTAYFSFRDWMSSLVEAILALISSKTTAIFCGLAMVVGVVALSS